jgi:hypothetical protein
MSLERDAITHALKTAPNITEAARQLGSSRRTLQNRMRFYQIPPGKSGRPRELLPRPSRAASPAAAPAAATAASRAASRAGHKSSMGEVFTVGGLLAGVFLAVRWWRGRSEVA